MLNHCQMTVLWVGLPAALTKESDLPPGTTLPCSLRSTVFHWPQHALALSSITNLKQVLAYCEPRCGTFPQPSIQHMLSEHYL